jgi:hypothetical protein
MKTAVSQMITELQEQFPKEMGDMYERNQLLLEDIALRAKEMEKEQKIKFAENCLDKALDLDIRTAFSNVEKYYNETFKQ